MGLLGSSKSSANETNVISQADNKAVNDVQDNGSNRNLAGALGNNINEQGGTVVDVNTNKHGTSITNVTTHNQDFNKSFGLEVVDKAIEAINQNLGRSFDFTDKTINRVLSDQSSQLATISKTPDDRLEGMTKLFMIGAALLGAFTIYKR